MTGSWRILLAAVLAARLGSATSCFGQVSAAAAEPKVQLQVGSEYRLWSYAAGQGEVRARQHYAPLDLSWQARPWLGLSAGADLLYRQVKGPDGENGGTEPGEVRFSARTDLLDNRLSLVAGGARALVSSSLTLGEANLAETLENSVLAFPWIRSAWGNRAQFEIAGQCLRRHDLLVQLGACYERRFAYDLYEGGPRFRPGDLIRLGGEAQAARGSWKHELMLRLDRPGKSTLESGAAYRTGALLQIRLGAERSLALGGSMGLGLGLSRLGKGAVEEGPALDEARLAGGSLLWTRAFWRCPVGAALGEASLGGGALRGLHGDLGHATYIEPGLALSTELLRGVLRLDLRASLGKNRAGGRLRGLSFSWSWSGGLG